ncbi:MAG: hypothetical protein U0794_20220 [Isosphaeraceae bacterium]
MTRPDQARPDASSVRAREFVRYSVLRMHAGTEWSTLLRWTLLAFGLGVVVPTVPAADPPDLPRDVFVAAPTQSGLPRLPDDVFTRPEDEGAVDVVLFARSRAALVRLDVTIGDRPYRRSFDGFVRELHAYLDRNDDGVLTDSEATMVPWGAILNNPIFGQGLQVPGAKPRSLDSAPKDGVVSFEELTDYIRDTQGIGSLSTQSGQPPDARTEAFYSQLDLDQDRRVSAAECDAMMTRLDRDEDEFVSLDELTPDRMPSTNRFFSVRINPTKLNPARDAAVFLDSPQTRTAVTQRLLETYGKDAAGSNAVNRAVESLPVSALLMDPGQRRLADSNHDGRFDRRELEALLAFPAPVARMVVRLPSPGAPLLPSTPTVSLAQPADRPGNVGLHLRDGENGTKLLILDDVEFTAQLSENNQNLDDFMRQQFDQADTNKNGQIEASESRGNRAMQSVFLLADRDKSGGLTRDEYNRYLELLRDSGQTRAVAGLSDRGTGLFSNVDINNDSRLSLREIRGSVSALGKLDRDHDGRVTPEELPHRYELSVGRGQSVNRQVFAAVTQRSVSDNAATNASGIVPVWFLGMDRNGDGDVSTQEFLGPADVFRRLDGDNDGLIDSREAQQLR